MEGSGTETWTHNYSELKQAMNWEVNQQFSHVLYVFKSLWSLLAGREQVPGPADDSCSWGLVCWSTVAVSSAVRKCLIHVGKGFQSRTWPLPTPTWNTQDLFNSLHIIVKWGKSSCLWSYHTSPMISETSIKPRILNQNHTTTITMKRAGRRHHSKLETHP